MTIFEFDTAIGKKYKKALLAINDRATDMCWLALLERKEAKSSTRAEIEKLKPNESRKVRLSYYSRMLLCRFYDRNKKSR